MKECWCIAPAANAAFVAQMEDVLEVYQRPYDPRYPQVCMDETSVQLLDSLRPLKPVCPGQRAKEDSEYERHGTTNLFLACEPLRGWRQVSVTAQRTKGEWAHFVRALVDVQYPNADRIVLVRDNLNTHSPASLYEAFAPSEARRIAERLEIHHTPKHGSWLNMAEIEFSVLGRQCLARRIPTVEALQRETAAWEHERNAATVTIDWRFTTADARIKLKHLYPVLLTSLASPSAADPSPADDVLIDQISA